MAALTRSSREPSGTAMTDKARQVFWDSFQDGHTCALCEAAVIDQALPAAERARQAVALRTLHYSRIARNARRAAASARASRAPDAAL